MLSHFHAIAGEYGPRLDILHFLHRAYVVRSTIAHGSQPKPKDLRGLDGSVCATIQEFAAELERVMRVAVRRAVDHVASSGGFLTGDEWNVLILDGEDARR